MHQRRAQVAAHGDGRGERSLHECFRNDFGSFFCGRLDIAADVATNAAACAWASRGSGLCHLQRDLRHDVLGHGRQYMHECRGSQRTAAESSEDTRSDSTSVSLVQRVDHSVALYELQLSRAEHFGDLGVVATILSTENKDNH